MLQNSSFCRLRITNYSHKENTWNYPNFVLGIDTFKIEVMGFGLRMTCWTQRATVFLFLFCENKSTGALSLLRTASCLMSNTNCTNRL